MTGKIPDLYPGDGFVRMKGVAHRFYSQRWQRWVWRSLPKSDGAESPARKRQRDTFKLVVQGIKNVPPDDYTAAVELAKNSPYLRRDILMKAAQGTLVHMIDTDGRYWMGTRDAIQAIQPMLDSISATPGAMIYRGTNYWADIAPGSPGQVLSIDIDTGIPKWVPSEDVTLVVLGAGAPIDLAPPGIVYSQTDEAKVWTSQPIPLGEFPTVVQSASVASSAEVEGPMLGAAPTEGNLIIAIVGSNVDVSGFLSLDWGLITKGGVNRCGMAVYRYVQSGDGAALPSITTGATAFNYAGAWEVSGMTGDIATDLEGYVSVFDQNTDPFNSGSGHTAVEFDLVLLGSGTYDGGSAYAVPSGWTSDQNARDAGNYGSWLNASRVFPDENSQVQASIDKPGGDDSFTITIIVKNSNGSFQANWEPIGIEPLGNNVTPGIVRGDGTTIDIVAGVATALGTSTTIEAIAYSTSGLNALPPGAIGTVVFDTMVSDNTSGQYDPTTGILTPTAPGTWVITSNGSGITTSTLGEFAYIFMKNGIFGSPGAIQIATALVGLRTGTAAQSYGAVIVAIVTFNGTTDNVRVQAQVNGGSGSDFVAAGAVISAVRVG
jgi:hypothetical protein